MSPVPIPRRPKHRNAGPGWPSSARSLPNSRLRPGRAPAPAQSAAQPSLDPGRSGTHRRPRHVARFDRVREFLGVLILAIEVALGYSALAHYLTFLIEKGQQTLIELGDPFGRGWQPFADATPSLWLSEHTSILAGLKVGFVVIGHVMAVAAAHDRALILLPKAHRLSGQLALLMLMVAYTFTGLFLLFSV